MKAIVLAGLLAAAGSPPPFGKGVVAFGAAGDHTVSFVAAGDAAEMQTVKGAPYTAEAVTEIEQVLADGNRIVHRTTASIARDSAGRTRREQGLAAIGRMIPEGEMPKLVFIQDPVAGRGYILEPEGRIARKLPEPGLVGRVAGPGPGPVPAKASAPLDEDVTFEIPLPPPPHAFGGPVSAMLPFPVVSFENAREPERQDLGSQLVEGLACEGRRSTITIPAGEIGNERPIEIVSERWLSRELQVVVLSRHHDPRFGETTYRLTGISRDEPPASLFAVPPGYTVRDGLPRPPSVGRGANRPANPSH